MESIVELILCVAGLGEGGRGFVRVASKSPSPSHHHCWQVWPGIACYCMVLPGIVWYHMVSYGITLYCMVLCGIIWYCTVSHGIAWPPSRHPPSHHHCWQAPCHEEEWERGGGLKDKGELLRECLYAEIVLIYSYVFFIDLYFYQFCISCEVSRDHMRRSTSQNKSGKRPVLVTFRTSLNISKTLKPSCRLKSKNIAASLNISKKIKSFRLKSKMFDSHMPWGYNALFSGEFLHSSCYCIGVSRYWSWLVQNAMFGNDILLLTYNSPFSINLRSDILLFPFL